jgi:predicted ester cyclase
MLNVDRNKQTIQALIQIVWQNRNLAALPDFWTEDCINHAMPADNNRGLEVLHSYHEQFLVDFSAFANLQIKILQQIAEGDRVVTYLIAQGQHIKPFLDIPPTGRDVSLSTIRIDRMKDGKIAEHWSIADLAGFMQQLKS